jgi:hypothetical protein
MRMLKTKRFKWTLAISKGIRSSVKGQMHWILIASSEVVWRNVLVLPHFLFIIIVLSLPFETYLAPLPISCALRTLVKRSVSVEARAQRRDQRPPSSLKWQRFQSQSEGSESECTAVDGTTRRKHHSQPSNANCATQKTYISFPYDVLIILFLL